jgi:glycosyltransferase involved in cell wall biosynthesis
MLNKKRYSLVLATLGRKETVERFLESVQKQTYPRDLIQVVIVDQNRDSLLDDIVAKYESAISIQHIKSPVLGLSVNRNFGLNAATGDVVAFPDDDCQYPPELIDTVDRALTEDDLDFVMGKIWDPEKNVPAIRKWPDARIKINRFNFYRLTSSITLFTRLKAQRFDERFGLGAKFGSNEDAIYVLSMLSAGARGVYLPNMRIYHEDQPISTLDRKKVAGYAMGFGHFVREYRCTATLAIFALSIAFQALGFIKALACLDFRTASLRTTSLKARIVGFIS